MLTFVCRLHPASQLCCPPLRHHYASLFSTRADLWLGAGAAGSPSAASIASPLLRRRRVREAAERGLRRERAGAGGNAFLDGVDAHGSGRCRALYPAYGVLSAPPYVLVLPVSISSSSSKLAGPLGTFPQAFWPGSFLFYLSGAVLGLCRWADFSLVADS